MKKMMQEVTTGMKDIRVKVENLEHRINRQQTAPPVVTQAPAVYLSRATNTSSGGTTTTSWEQAGVYVPQNRRLQEHDGAVGQGQRRGPFFCYNCGEVSHYKRDCRAPISYAVGRSGAGQSAHSEAADNSTLYHRSPDAQFMSGGIPGGLANSERVYLNVKIFGRTRLCLLGSGSEVTLIPSSFIGSR